MLSVAESRYAKLFVRASVAIARKPPIVKPCVRLTTLSSKSFVASTPKTRAYDCSRSVTGRSNVSSSLPNVLITVSVSKAPDEPSRLMAAAILSMSIVPSRLM